MEDGRHPCGTHWVWEITSMLMKGKADHEETIKESSMIEFNDPETLQKIKSPRIFNSHLHFRNLPSEIIKKKCKIIFINRNPKDICVSYFHHCRNLKHLAYDGKWEDFFHLFLETIVFNSQWADYTLDWERSIKCHEDLQVIELQYEDLKRDSSREITKLAKFLGVGASCNLISEIADKCSFENMKTANTEIKKHRASSHMYRKGETGGWKNFFTVAQNEIFDSFLKDKMKDSTFQFKYEL